MAMDMVSGRYALRPGFLQGRASVVQSVVPRRCLLTLLTSISLSGASSSTAAGVEPELPRFQKTASGLKIQDVSQGDGVEARKGRIVEFNYVCRRSNGYYVYSTMDMFNKDNEPVTVALGEGKLIPGLEEVIIGMKAGGKRRVLIPPNLGYVSPELEPQPSEFGPRRSLMAHANEPLVFEIQLIKVTD